MEKTHANYLEFNEKLLEGFTVKKVTVGINHEDTGMMLELERQIDNVTIGMDLIYDPEHEDRETELMISREYVKSID